jgi:hypothetical protein
MKRIATLCAACIKAYTEAGYTFRPFIPFQKEPCDICMRQGFTGILHETDRKNQERSKEDGG